MELGANDVTVHDTLTKFGFPESLLFQTRHWAVVLRPAQVTFGSMVIISKDSEARSLADLNADSAREFLEICARIETILTEKFGAQKFNYLCLMMVDPHVHFHFLPRYRDSVEYSHSVWRDELWPGPPDIKTRLEMSGDDWQSLRDMLSTALEEGEN